MKKYLAELIGTFTLVLFGCGAAVLAGDQIGLAGISMAFGFALIGMAYGIGPISGCHINPAVSIGAFVAGRLPAKDLVPYIIAQCVGAILASGLLLAIASGKADYSLSTNGLGQNTFGTDYNFQSAWIFETAATFIFLVVILGATQKSAPASVAGLAIGITLVVIHLVGIPVTGVSVNPARSLGPALWVKGEALKQLWVFLVFPSLGALVAGLFFRSKALEN